MSIASFLVPAIVVMLVSAMPTSSKAAAASQSDQVDWVAFLSRNDMVWNKLPTSWNNGPFVGNGKLGTILWQEASGGIHFEVSRSDLYDHRRMDKAHSILFSHVRLPNGHFELAFGSTKPTGTMRLDLWNAELQGELRSGSETYQVRCFTAATEDVIVLEIASSAQAKPTLVWHPELSKPTRQANMPADLRAYPPQAMRQVGDTWVSVQEMPDSPEYHTDGLGAGQYATAWTQVSAPNRTIYFISTQITFPGTTAGDKAMEVVRRAKTTGLAAVETAHRDWWHRYYPKSLLSVPDADFEGFYWIQMYKMASASRQGGPVLDLMGPWFAPTPWPAVWWNLNIQLTYWPYYMSNHLDEAEPLAEVVWNQRNNLADNAAPFQADSYAVGRATGLDCAHPVGVEVGNLPWTMHNLWLHYRSTMDDTFLRDRLFPMMKGSFRYLRHILIAAPDGTLRLPKTASPEYTDAVESCSYTLANIRWIATTLIQADARLKASDPVVTECQEVLAKLEPYPIDPATGIMVGKDTPLAQSHRHWSHLFMIYPYYEYAFDQPEHVALIEKSLNNWTDKPKAFAGYSWLGAASMHAAAGRGDRALEFLNTFLHHSPQPNTLYREWGPCMETPLAFARTMQEMMLTSHGDLIRVFPGVPSVWKDAVFANFRTEGAFLVSARRSGGVTQYIRITSLAGEPCHIRTGLSGEVKGSSDRPFTLRNQSSGISEVALDKGQTILLYSGTIPAAPTSTPVAITGPTNRWGGEVPKPMK